jgi:acetyl-CoA acetyltransferase
MAANGIKVAVVGSAQSPLVRRAEVTEVQMLLPVLRDALASAGLTRQEIDFTCSGSCDYLSGQSFSFVSNLDAVGAWPPISESHVEMDGAWALYEAWVRLQHGDIETALVFGSGKSSNGDVGEVYPLETDPYYLAPLGADPWTLAALQARALLDAGLATERDFAAIAVRSGRGDDVGSLLERDYVRAPLRRHDVPPVTDGACAVVLATERKARELCERPAWITGLDHRSEIHQPGLRDLTDSPSTRIAAQRAGLDRGPVEVAELQAPFTAQEVVLRRALGFNGEVDVNPSGGPLAHNPVMATGLIRIAEAAAQITDHGRQRVLAHATSGPCLQQNLVCILEGSAE